MLKNMEADEIAPIIAEPTLDSVPPISRWRWWFHLFILALFPIMAGIMGILLSQKERSTPLLPRTIRGLLLMSGEQMVFFGGFFVVAWIASRVNRRQLLLPWRGGMMPVIVGLAYSIALRLLIMVVAVTAVIFWMLGKMILQNGRTDALNAQSFLPHVEKLVNVDALANNPVYFALMLTLISFVVAGFREELWRSGMLAGIKALFPKQMSKPLGQAAAISIVAVLFGLAHTPQGVVGVGVTTVLGLGLGAIMLRHQSIWEAVIAHGFFDAATFVFLYVMGKYPSHQLPGF